MARRFFSSDFHLGFRRLMEIEKWPFSSIEEHDAALIRSCTLDAGEDDTIIHVGDLASVGIDSHGGLKSVGLSIKPSEALRGIKAEFINVRGNHDPYNHVKSCCDSMRTRVGRRFQSVSVCHYPTYDRRAEGHFLPGDVHLCGHVHSAWKYCLDLDHQCLNVNVGCMVWGFKLVSEEELAAYIGIILSRGPDDLFRCRTFNGRLKFMAGKTEKEKLQ